MQKIYIVRLSDEEREICLHVVKKLKGSSGKVRRTHILLKADADGSNWKDQDIADTYYILCIVHRKARMICEQRQKMMSILFRCRFALL